MVGVGVVILKGMPGGADERVLLIRRGTPPRHGEWSLPGGRQEPGERVRDAALREVAEETGLAIDLTALVDCVDHMEHDAAGNLVSQYTLVDFLGEWRGGEPQAGSDAAATLWADPERLAPFDLWSETARVIALARRMRNRGTVRPSPP